MICPAKRDVPPCPSLMPARAAVVVIVTARVVESWLKSASVHTKQIRFTFEGDRSSALACEVGPSPTDKEAFGAPSHVPNEVAITSCTLRLPVTLLPVLGFKFQTTGKEVKSQRSILALDPVNCGSHGNAGAAAST